jgi:hypothetical protein
MRVFNREANVLQFGTGNTQRAVITSTGNLGINEPFPGAKLTVEGAAGTIYLNPDFDGGRRTAFQTMNTLRFGFIGQEYREVFPGAVRTDENEARRR